MQKRSQLPQTVVSGKLRRTSKLVGRAGGGLRSLSGPRINYSAHSKVPQQHRFILGRHSSALKGGVRERS